MRFAIKNLLTPTALSLTALTASCNSVKSNNNPVSPPSSASQAPVLTAKPFLCRQNEDGLFLKTKLSSVQERNIGRFSIKGIKDPRESCEKIAEAMNEVAIASPESGSITLTLNKDKNEILIASESSKAYKSVSGVFRNPPSNLYLDAIFDECRRLSGDFENSVSLGKAWNPPIENNSISRINGKIFSAEDEIGRTLTVTVPTLEGDLSKTCKSLEPSKTPAQVNQYKKPVFKNANPRREDEEAGIRFKKAIPSAGNVK